MDTTDMVRLADGIDLRMFVSDCYALSAPPRARLFALPAGARCTDDAMLWLILDAAAASLSDVDLILLEPLRSSIISSRAATSAAHVRSSRSTGIATLRLRDGLPCAPDHAADRAHYQDLLAAPEMVWMADSAKLSPIVPPQR